MADQNEVERTDLTEVETPETEATESPEENLSVRDVIDRLEGKETDEEVSTGEEEPAQEAQEEVSEEEAKPADESADPAPRADSKYKPPIDWSPQLKQEFKNLPESVRQAIHNNEVSRAQLMQSTADDRRTAHQLREIIAPFKGLMAAEGVRDPLAGINGLLITTSQLHFGNPQQKAHKIADLIKHYNVDIETLDQVLSGQQQQQPQQQAQPVNDPRIDAIWQRLQQQDQRQQYQMQSEAMSSIDQFSGNEQNEFFEDVRYIMADFLDVAAQRGQQMTLEEAYQRACWAHPEVAKIMEQRRDKKPGPTIDSKRTAASSISGKRGGTPRPDNNPESVRGALEAAWPERGRI